MRLFKPFLFIKLFYPGAVFRIKTGNKELCLTFDDGPDPDSTPRILDILDTYNIKAIFFCIGHKAEKYPQLVTLIRSKGHIVGNHGYQHLDGWETKTRIYIDNVSSGAKFTSPYLFRPSYGRLRLSQFHKLVKNNTIVFWDLMPYDYDELVTSEKVLNILKREISPGSVILLHDKTTSKALSVLGEFIKYAENKGYKFVINSFSGKK
jgi:peptidoglycan/xylan/chitin deacetylase (PgdA/CDA1 family)